jgi:EmrB/QacA subfamily drug resistance transporter
MSEAEAQADNSLVERSALIVASLTSFMGPFMISAVNVGLPAIQQDYLMNAVELSWVTTAYMLAVAMTLVPAGKAGDVYGRKKIFLLGLVINTLAVAAAPLAPSTTSFLCARVLQGIGAALYVTTGMAILTSVFAPQKRGRAIGVYVSAVYIGLSAGPGLGGMVIENFGWRTLFYSAVPMGIFCILLTLRFLKGEWRGEAGQRLDPWASLLYALTIICIVYGGARLISPLGALLCISGLLLAYAFVRHQLAAASPIFEFRLFSGNRTFTFSSLAALLHYSATFGVTFLLSLYLQFIKGLSPQQAGLILMVQPLMMALLSPLSGRASDRYGPRGLASAGMAMTFAGIVFFALLTPQTSLLWIIANLLFLGSGFALFSSPNMSAIMGAVEKKYLGLASGTVATMRLLGQVASMALATSVLSLILGEQSLSPETNQLLLLSITIVLASCALLCLIGIYFSWYRDRGECPSYPASD